LVVCMRNVLMTSFTPFCSCPCCRYRVFTAGGYGDGDECEHATCVCY
jgi:hypothetical protein